MIKEKKSPEDMARILYSRFKAKDTANGIQYSLGGIYVRSIVSYVSQKARRQIEDVSEDAIAKDEQGNCIGIYYAKVRPSVMGVRREHMIPISAAYQHLNDVYKSKRCKEKEFEKYIVKLRQRLHIALITEEEDKVLNVKARETAPNNWWKLTCKELLSRYNDAGLTDIEWERSFLTADMSPRREKKLPSSKVRKQKGRS